MAKAKINLQSVLLLSITGRDEVACLEKIKELNALGVKEAGLFLEFLVREQRKRVYAELLKSGLKKIPLVHIRHDMTKDELKFLKNKFKTRYFTLHEVNFQHDDIFKWRGFYKNLYLEMNFDNFVSKKVEVEKIGGFCIDLAHFKVGLEMLNKDFNYVYSKRYRSEYFACNHLNGWNPAVNCDMHTIGKLEDFDYLKTLPDFLFSRYIALEVFNSIKEQLEFKKYLVRILAKKLVK